MQPNQPSTPSQPAAPRPRSSNGPGMVVGILALVAGIYVLDHVGKGETAVFGGVDRHIAAQDFHGAQCTAIFGSCKIDLRDAQMPGREAVVQAYAIFGGIEVRVPEDWEVVNHSLAIFGGSGDRRGHAPRGPDSKTLILEGASIFGGVNVRN